LQGLVLGEDLGGEEVKDTEDLKAIGYEGVGCIKG
jgi:hypothetical protein